MKINFSIDMEPIPQPRQRHKIVNEPNGRCFVANYTPSKSNVAAFKQKVALYAKMEYKGPLIETPVMVSIIAIFNRPGYMIPAKFGCGRIPFSRKPDVDNMAKSIFDALTKTILKDDAIIYISKIEKYYAGINESGHCEIMIDTNYLKGDTACK